ncbi:hypothetical protein GCM10009804_31630 [Kribbella hippodromi]|uniref:Uncharacterized protein n=1 Tax=Kribbella hippodromi TaxID=434347 RepID=A0ABN2D9L7_9ACTN
MKTYGVTVSRDERWWMVSIPEIEGLTQARRLDEVERMAREYVAVTTDVPLSAVAVEVSGIEADGQDLLEAKKLVDGLRRRAKELDALVAELTREVAAVLTDASVPVRDVSSVLGVSHQRVSQLVQAAAGGAEAPSAEVLRRAREEFAQDLVIHLDDGRSLQLVEVPRTKARKRRRKPQDEPERQVQRRSPVEATDGRSARKTARSHGAKRADTRATPRKLPA